LKLGKLIALYDSNDITIDGKTDLSFTEDVKKRFEAYGWGVVEVDGHNREKIREGIQASQKDANRPSLVICKTIIGYGSPNKQGTSGVHGAPLGEDELKLTKEKLGIPQKDFYVDADIKAIQERYVESGAQYESTWKDKMSDYSTAEPAST